MRTFWASLIHFWQIHLTVALCTAVATGVLAGALIVGNSVRGSLKAVTLERLGTIEHVLLADRFFTPELLRRRAMVPAILLNGTVVVPSSQTRASKVNIHGINRDFFQFWDNSASPHLNQMPGASFPSVVINTALQTELGVEVGDELLINFPRVADISRDFLLGRRETSAVIQTLRLIVSAIIPTQDAGRFHLLPHQRLPLNAFIALPVLQQAVGQKGKVNALFTSQGAAISPDALALTLDGLGLKIHEHGAYFNLQSEQYLLKPHFSEVALSVARENDMSTLPTLTYLANTITVNGKTVPYSTIVALPRMESVPIADNEILLNSWAATALGAKVGDSIEVTYYRVDAAEQYTPETALFRLKAVIPIEALAETRRLIPEFPGIHDATDMSNWDAPFPIDYSLIGANDEAYWDAYGATPKGFIFLETGKRLWKNRFGELTSIRLERDVALERFETGFLKRIEPEQVGFQFLSPRADGLRASSGTTDFGALFSGMSGLIIFSVAYLIRLLFQIGVEQRAREIGLLRAVGYPLVSIRRRFLQEAAIVAGLGSLLGCVFAIGYAHLMLHGLRTWWLPAIGTPFVTFHMRGWTLLTGISIAMAVVLLTIRQGIAKLGRGTPSSLLSGGTDVAEAKLTPKTARTPADAKRFKWRVGVITLILILIILSALTIIFFANLDFKVVENVVLHPVVQLLTFTFSIIGVGWLAFNRWLTSQKVPKRLTLLHFTLKNVARHPARAKSCVVMVSLACCIVVAVGINRQAPPPPREIAYTFVAEADIPLHHRLNTPDGRFELGFSEKDSQLLSSSDVIPFRVLPGEDVSCLNLYQPQKPQILGVSNRVLDERPWRHIRRGGDNVYALADENSIRWVLHHNPDEEFLIEDEFGNPLGLHLYTLQNSLFQSQLIISESNFMKYFPSQSGYRYFLIKTPPQLWEETSKILEKTLADYGFDVTLASARLANYQGVTNAYISTFQSLGGFGIIIGTFGLALVLFRNIIERRGELATLRAFGFRRQLLSRMLFIESSFLLIVGMFIGSAAGFISVLGGQGYLPSFPLLTLTITLLLIVGFGIMANAVAVAVALRSPLLATLKKDL